MAGGWLTLVDATTRALRRAAVDRLAQLADHGSLSSAHIQNDGRDSWRCRTHGLAMAFRPPQEPTHTLTKIQLGALSESADVLRLDSADRGGAVAVPDSARPLLLATRSFQLRPGSITVFGVVSRRPGR